MGIFSAIADRILHHASASGNAQQTQQSSSSKQQGAAQAPSLQQGQSPGQQQPQAQPQLQLQSVDIDATLSQLAAKKGGGGNYRQSIVDLLKLLDLDSSLDARKKLADELDVHEGAPGTAEENIALHKAVMRKIAENGGKVPDSMKH